MQVYNGIQISRVGKHVYELSQEYGILQFLAKCPIQDVNPCDSPLLPSDTFVLAGQHDEAELCDEEQKQQYQHILGSLNWFNIATRPDLSITCSLAGRVASRPTRRQFKQLCRVVGYLKDLTLESLTVQTRTTCYEVRMKISRHFVCLAACA